MRTLEAVLSVPKEYDDLPKAKTTRAAMAHIAQLKTTILQRQAADEAAAAAAQKSGDEDEDLDGEELSGDDEDMGAGSAGEAGSTWSVATGVGSGGRAK